MARNDFIDYLRGILITLVTYGHTLQYLLYAGGDGFWDDPIFQGIYMFHMPLFMAVSGYVSFGAIGRHSVREIVVSRFRQLVVPIACWALLFKGAASILIVAQGKVSAIDTLVGFPREVAEEMGGRFWFLWSVFGASVLFAAAHRIRVDHAPGLAVMVAISFLLPDGCNLHLYKYMLPFFALGYLAAANSLPQRLTACRWWLVPACIAVAVSCGVCWQKSTYVYVSGMALTWKMFPHMVLRFGGGIALGVLVVAVTKWLHGALPSRTLSRLGRDSLQIYLLQAYLFVLASRIPWESPRHGWGGALIAPVIAVGLTLVLDWGASILCRNRWASSLLCGRPGATRS